MNVFNELVILGLGVCDDVEKIEELEKILGSVNGGSLVEKVGNVNLSVRVSMVRGSGSGREVKRGGMKFNYDSSVVNYEGEYRVKVECGDTGEVVYLCSIDRNFLYRFIYRVLKGESIGRTNNYVWVELVGDFNKLKKGCEGAMEVWGSLS